MGHYSAKTEGLDVLHGRWCDSGRGLVKQSIQP